MAWECPWQGKMWMKTLRWQDSSEDWTNVRCFSLGFLSSQYPCNHKMINKQLSDEVYVISNGEGQTLETSAFESFYGGQFTLSTQLITPNIM